MFRILGLLHLVNSIGFENFRRPYADPECPDIDLYDKCVDKCVEETARCVATCNGDLNCAQACFRDQIQCTDVCPCQIGCPNGCSNCPNPICECNELESNADWNRCIDDNGSTLGRCVHACGDDERCELDCLAEFKTRQNSCPCESDCPYGCPCDGFECAEVESTTPTTTTTTAEVQPTGPRTLVLDNYGTPNPPFTVDLQGNIDDVLLSFNANGTITYGSCGAILNGEFLVFGGSNGGSKYQISRIEGCELTRIGNLVEPFYWGACGTYNFEQNDNSLHRSAREKVLLCFTQEYSFGACLTYDGEIEATVASTTYDHAHTYHLANYQGRPLTVGSYSGHSKAEIMNSMDPLTWSIGADYPFHSIIYGYSTASTDNAAYIIGGYGTYRVSTVAEFKDDAWRKYADLTFARSHHSSITIGGETMILGGVFNDSGATEVWNFQTGEQREITPTLRSAEYWTPILFAVEFDFCRL